MSGKIRSKKMAREAKKNANQSQTTDNPEIVVHNASSEYLQAAASTDDTEMAREPPSRGSVISGMDSMSTGDLPDDMLDPEELEEAGDELLDELGDEEEEEKAPESRRLSTFSRKSLGRSNHILPQILLHSPDLKAIYDEGLHSVDPDPPFITPYPDIEEMYQKALLKMSLNCTADVFRLELRRIYEVLSKVRSNEAEFKRKLSKREHEVEDLSQKLKLDARVTKALLLADRWRKEKSEAEEMNRDYQAELNNVRADVRTLEANVTNLRKINRKLTEELEARKKLEKQVEGLEEMNLRKEQTITELREALIHTKQIISEERHHFQKEKEDILAKVDVSPAHTHSLLVELHKQVEKLKFDNLKLKNENLEKGRTLKHYESSLKQTQLMASELKSQGKHMKAHLKRMENRIMELMISQSNLEKQKEKLILLSQSLNTEGTLRGQHYKMLGRTLGKCEAQKSLLFRSVMSQNKVIYQEQETSKELRVELKQLVHELAASRELESNILNVLEQANRQIQTLKNKLLLSDAKVNTGVAEVKRQKSLLHSAKATAETLSKNLKNVISEMKLVYYKMGTCMNDNIDKNNLIRHMDSLCRQYQDTIRIRDADNDSLVIGSQKMEHLLKKTRDGMLALRQKNAEAATEAHLQEEIFSLVKYMLKFTETEKETAIKIACNSDSSLIIMKQENAKRVTEILKLSEDVYAQKMLVKNFIKTLEHEKHENNHLIHLLHEADLEHQGLIRKNYALMQQRDVLGAMVIRHNTENELILKKMYVMNSMINAGHQEVLQINMDMRILKLEIRNLRRRLKSYEGIDCINAEIRRELVETSRALQLEQYKRVTVERLKPIVPHPDRYIQNARPSEYELIEKIHKLQETLTLKYRDCEMKENTILFKNQQLLQMKILLARRPGTKCYEDLWTTKELVVRKNKQIKSLLSELNIAKFENEMKDKDKEELLAEMKRDKTQLAELKRKLNAKRTTTCRNPLTELAKRTAPCTEKSLNIGKPKMITATLAPLNLAK